MPKGIVKWFDTAKGFGFIAEEDGSDDVFVHVSSIIGNEQRNLKKGDKVSFNIEHGSRGRKATRVVKI